MDAQRIPFTEEDERRIASAATWGMIVAITTIISSLISLGVAAQMYFDSATLRQMHSIMAPMLAFSAVFSLISVLLNVWLLQASLAFRKVAITDEADQAHLLAGFGGLRAYFMAQVTVILLAAVGGVFMAVAS